MTMKIIVVGANEYGINIIYSLLKLRHDVVLIEMSEEYADFLRKESGLTVINGDAKLLVTLKKAEVNTADCVIALTADDAANIVISKLSSCYFDVSSTIAKISLLDYTEPEDFTIFSKNNFAISTVIDVDNVICDVMINTLFFHGAKDIAYTGKTTIVETICSSKSALVNTPISHISSLFDFHINILAIQRSNMLINLSQSDIIMDSDIVFFSVAEDNITEALDAFGHKQYVVQNILFVTDDPLKLKLANKFRNKLHGLQDTSCNVSFIMKNDVIFDDENNFLSIFGVVDAVFIYTDDVCFNTTLSCAVSSIDKNVRVISISERDTKMINSAFEECNYINVNTANVIKQSVLSSINGAFKIVHELCDDAGYIIEIKVSENHQWTGAAVKNFAYKFDIIPVSIQRNDNFQKIAEDNDILLIGDTVSIFVSQKGLKRLLKML